MTVFQIFQQHRFHLLRWLEAHPGKEGANEVLEAIVRTSTFTGTRGDMKDKSQKMKKKKKSTKKDLERALDDHAHSYHKNVPLLDLVSLFPPSQEGRR
ncbi:ef hand domain-containing protein, partial [Cystoisospora suis]